MSLSPWAEGGRELATPRLAFGATALLVVAVLTALVSGETQRSTTVFGVVIVAAAFALPRRQRGPVVGAALLAWAVALGLGGDPAPIEVVTQLGGAVLLALVALRTTASLETALRIERQASRASRTRASLLGSVLRLRSLEPAAVSEAVVGGLRDAGFDTAGLRVVEGGALRLVAALPAGGHDPAIRLAADSGLVGAAWRTGHPVVVPDYSSHPLALPGSGTLGGAVAAPVRVDGEVAAVLFAARRQVGVNSEQVRAVELLAEEAGAALQRARSFAADTATVIELRRLDERTHDFVSTVSHELRTPMTVIDGLGQTLHRRWDDLDPERRDDLLRRIDQNAERLGTMLRSLVDTSALERGQLVVRPERVDLGACVRAVLGRLAPLLDRHPTTVVLPDDLAVEADPSLIQHVIENLLSNAAHHTPAGTPVQVRACRVGDEVEVEVSDAGPGIAPEDLPHVLERFYRAGPTTTRPSGGLGLGLALSRQVLHAHGRDLRVASVQEEGTQFTFRLPVAPGGPEPVTAADR